MGQRRMKIVRPPPIQHHEAHEQKNNNPATGALLSRQGSVPPRESDAKIYLSQIHTGQLDYSASGVCGHDTTAARGAGRSGRGLHWSCEIIRMKKTTTDNKDAGLPL